MAAIRPARLRCWATQLSPDEIDPALLVARGMVQLANHQPAEALTALRMAVALGETAPPTLLNLALAEAKGRRRGRAPCN